MRLSMLKAFALALMLAPPALCHAESSGELRAYPAQIKLRGQSDQQSLVVQLVNAQGLTRDVTDQVKLTLADPKLARLEGQTIRPQADGETKLVVELDARKIEVPVVVGKENPVIKTLWQHIPQGGKKSMVDGVKINAADLLPADHGFYRFPGSLTTPICNEGVQWYLMRHPIEMSKAQIAKYKKYYHDTARPLQHLNNRPLVESK